MGICYGFQLAIVEFARNVCGLKDANTTEVDPNTSNPVIDLLPEQRNLTLKGGTMRLGSYPIKLVKDTLAYRTYGSEIVYERHRHRYEVNPKYFDILQKNGLIFSGFSLEGNRVEFAELKNGFYLLTQAHPEFKSRPTKPSPPYYALVKYILDKRLNRIVEEEHA